MVRRNRLPDLRTPALFLLSGFLLAFLLCPGAGVPVVQAQSRLVVDQAGLFSAAEAEALASRADALSTQYQLDVVIVTTDDSEGKTARAYADDFFDGQGYGRGADRDGILFLIDLDNREAYISTSGSGIRYLTDQRINTVLDQVLAAGLADGQYAAAADAFLEAVAGYLAQGIPAGQYETQETPANTLTWPEALAGLAAAGVTGLGFVGVNRRRYKGSRHPGVFDYHSNSLVSLGVITDNLVNTHVTSRLLPKQQAAAGSGSGRSSVHTSSSGRSHGGGGRKF
jgi:uncharacterized protein